MLSMLQSYSKFYNDQTKELENFLISKKVELANKLSLTDEYKKNIKRLQKKLVEMLKNNHHFQYEYMNHSKYLKRWGARKSKSQNNFMQKSPILYLKTRCFSFEIKIEKDSDQKESKFYYKMTLLQMAHQHTGNHKNSNPLTITKSAAASQKTIKHELEIKTNPEIRRKTISVVMNHFNRSPSLLLKFSNNSLNDFLSVQSDSNEKNNEIWQKNILPLMRTKQNRDQTLKEIKNTLKRYHIPSKLRGTIWSYVKKFEKIAILLFFLS